MGMSRTQTTDFAKTLQYGAMAGAAGGVAEILWIALYSAITGTDAAGVAQGVTAAFGLSGIVPESSVTLGLAIHMLLAIGLGLALGFAWRVLASRSRAELNTYALIVAALAGVWAVNFFILLPALSPGFVHLVPYPVSLLSKLLFGLAAAETFRRANA
jgi:hypothetical protein